MPGIVGKPVIAPYDKTTTVNCETFHVTDWDDIYYNTTCKENGIFDTQLACNKSMCARFSLASSVHLCFIQACNSLFSHDSYWFIRNRDKDNVPNFKKLDEI